MPEREQDDPLLRTRLSREDWIQAALSELSGHGPDALKIDRVAAKLGVSKGSFYMHFKARENWYDAILDEWSHSYTNIILVEQMLLSLEP